MPAAKHRVPFLQLMHIFIIKNALKVSDKQIMPEVLILGCIYALPANRDLMKGSRSFYLAHSQP